MLGAIAPLAAPETSAGQARPGYRYRVRCPAYFSSVPAGSSCICSLLVTRVDLIPPDADRKAGSRLPDVQVPNYVRRQRPSDPSGVLPKLGARVGQTDWRCV